MNIKKNYIIVLMVFGVFSNAVGVFAATQAQYDSLPPFLSVEVLPNVMFMLDNSGSMKQSLAESVFNPAKTYYGMFEGDKNYKYDATIPVGTGGYDGLPYNVNVSAAPTGAFVEDDSCTIGLGNNCWDGSYLNWMVTRRIDAARKVMVGGKVEDRDGHDYISGGDLEWKIVLNNEHSDRALHRTYSASQSYTPYPDDTAFVIYSPAADKHGNPQATYDPYGKLKVSVPAIIVDNTGADIGEYGTISRCGADAGANKWYTVSLAHDYSDPVVVAVPLAYYGRDPSVVRVSDVDASNDSFKIRIEEWEYKDGGHTGEDISYLVFEKGKHTLASGEIIFAGTKDIATVDGDVSVDITAAGYAAAPVVFSSVTTNNDENTVITRQKDITNINVTIKLQEEEEENLDGGIHNTETVSYIALEAGSYNDGKITAFQVGVQVNVDQDWSTISFTDTGINPSFLASMQTTNDNDPAALRYDNLNTDSVEVFVEEEKSADDEVAHVNEDVGYAIIYPTVSLEYNLALIVEEEPKGLLHDIQDKVRLGISFYNYKKDNDIYNGENFHGGTMKPSIPLNPFVKKAADTNFRSLETPVAADIDVIVDAIEHYPLVWGTTPLAENYYEVIRYFQQIAPFYPDINGEGESYDVDNDWDPYYFKDANGDGVENDPELVPCAESYVLVFTDGQPYRDDYLPCYSSGTDAYDGSTSADDSECTDYDGNNVNKEGVSNANNSNTYKDNLDDLALWARSVVDQSSYNTTGDRDLRSDAGLEGNQNLITYTVGFGSDTLKQILVDTAENGGGKSYAAEDGRELKNQLTNAFTDILSRSSGTSASVISNTRSGEGAIYQSVFFPSLKDSTNNISWAGQIHALLVDAFGNMREDTNGNDTLDLEDDMFIVFNDDGTADRYIDGDGNQRLELDTATCPKNPLGSTNCYDSLVENNVDLDDLNYLWNTSNWLNEISDASVESQRFYMSPAGERYIFTWVDANSNTIVDSSEIMDFTCTATPSEADLIDTSKIYPYLHLYSSFADRPTEVSSASTANLKNFLRVQTKRQINYIRGSDCVNSNDAEDCNTLPMQIGGVDIDNTEMRSRQFDYDQDGTIETWRLGDIIYSTPTLVGRPTENFHLLYRDSSYAPFVAKYQNRRQVVYSGANDGMVHAFNAGFYDPDSKRSCRSSDFTSEATCQDTTKPELGAELWAYVPFNLLPHLYWLTQPSYNETNHVYYIDQKPRIFDAKIFTEESQCSDSLDSNDDQCIHPGGWGTVMVIGMNLGGGSIIADIDKTDGDSPVAGDPTMKSAFMIFDITNPEAEPKLLAEVVMPKMGFSTSYPTVAVIKDGDLDGQYEDYASGENKWYLVFGSGPADSNGDPGTVDTASGEYDNDILDDVKSLQPGQFYLLDLVKLASNNELHTLNSSGVLTPGLVPYADNYDSNTFITTPISVDFNLDFNADALYFGTIEGDSTTGWKGKLRRIVIDNQNDSTKWDGNSVLFDAEKPISAAPAIGQDSDGTHWVFFGTGRYLTSNDKVDTSQQRFYGLKEKVSVGSEVKTWETLLTGNLIDVTDYEIYSDQSVSGAPQSDWESVRLNQLSKDGWKLDFSTGTGERNLGQAALAGGLLSFTTFTPESDTCSTGGESSFWALFYETGTAHHSGVLGTTTVTIGSENKEQAIKKISLGKGLATSPNIHVGSEEGSTVFVQSSTSEITRIEEKNPLDTKSGIQSWELQ